MIKMELRDFLALRGGSEVVYKDLPAKVLHINHDSEWVILKTINGKNLMKSRKDIEAKKPQIWYAWKRE